MAQPARNLLMTYDDYLALERETGVRHEYAGGVVWAMSGGTLRHSALKTNLTVSVGAALRGKPCRAFDADAKVRVSATNHTAYPDLSIVCGQLQPDDQDRHAIANPSVIFEVLAPGTAAWDRGPKFRSYQHIPSLRHYVLIDPKEVSVEHFARSEPDQWTYRHFAEGQTLVLDLPGGALTVALDDLYSDLPELVSEPGAWRNAPRDEPYSASQMISGKSVRH